jgi:hypothetical protein
MFSEKSYSEVNREERFFCFLFAHALLMSRQVRQGFAELAQRKCNAGLDSDKLEVYVEAAVLRDYWRDLGDPVAYSPDTHNRRRAVLDMIFEKYNISADVLDKHDLFWTSSEKKKLWNPNHWSIEALKKAGLDELIKVKWAFNAKPDILLISPESMLVIEAKVESAEGCKADVEYKQYEIQKLVTELWQLLIPQFKDRKLELVLLEVSQSRENSITWPEILDLITTSDVDAFTRNALEQLKRY